MASTTTWVKLEGLPELNRRLNLLASDLRTKVLIDSMKKALDRAKKDAEARAPAGSGEPWGAKQRAAHPHPGYLKQCFRIRKMRQKDPWVIEVQLQNTAYYALWVEYGHRIVVGGSWRKGKGKGKVIGFQAAHPFMQPTFVANKDYMISEVQAAIRRRLDGRNV